jgi:hypothetical protein
MHRLVPPQDGTTFDDRRRYVRHKIGLSPVIIVELGPNNGGTLINLSPGGLCLQGVAKLNPEAELTLHFRLQGIKQAIETLGHVTWLGPTQKEAGIAFKGLPGNTEKMIAEWIAWQELPAQGTETETDLHPNPPPTRDEAPALPIQASIPVILPHKEAGNAHSSSARGGFRSDRFLGLTVRPWG